MKTLSLLLAYFYLDFLLDTFSTCFVHLIPLLLHKNIQIEVYIFDIKMYIIMFTTCRDNNYLRT